MSRLTWVHPRLSRRTALQAGDWLRVTQAVISFDHPQDLGEEHALCIDLRTGSDPAAHVTLSSNGALVERYYYLNKEHTRYTIVDLQDGRLIAASSKPL